jgi:pimeloyl-ACP methyl ester carboxylesterase
VSPLLLLTAASLQPGFVEGRQPVGGGAVVHYVRGGKGEPVVLVHGFGETARMWRPLMPTLAKEYTVLAPDLPGLAGSSFMPTGVYDMKTVAVRLHEFVRRQGFKRIRLVGHDIGLMAVYAYAAQYPDEVSKLVLLDAPIPGIGDTWPKVFNNPALWHFHFPNSPIALKLVKGRERIFLDHFWMSFSAEPNDVKIAESEREAYTRLYARPGAMAALGYFKAFPTDAKQNGAFLAKGKLPMPVLTVEGERGMGGALKAQAVDVAEDVRSYVLKGAGHWLLDERPAQVKAYLMPFLRGAR